MDRDQSTCMLVQFKLGMCTCINATRKGKFKKEIEKDGVREGLYENVHCELALKKWGYIWKK